MTDLNTIINHLTLEQARAILRKIVEENRALAEQVITITVVQHEDEEWEDIALGLVDELERLQVEDVWDRSGPTRDGYVETDVVATEMIDDVLVPYMEEMKKYHDFGMSQEADELCKGTIAGFYRFEYHSATEFKEWSIDAPLAFAEAVVKAWKENVPSETSLQDLVQFNKSELNGWLTNSLNSRV